MTNNEETKPIELNCKRCGTPFYWSVGEQDYMKIMLEQGRIQEIFTPVRCHKCRIQKKENWERKFGTEKN